MHIWEVGSTKWISQSYQCHQPNLYNETQACHPRMESLKNFSIAMCTYTRVGHNFCNPNGLLLSFMSTCEFWFIGTLVNLFRKSCRTVGCVPGQESKSQQSRSKYNTHAKPAWRVITNIWWDVGHVSSDVIMPIAPPTGCGIRPAPNRNLKIMLINSIHVSSRWETNNQQIGA